MADQIQKGVNVIREATIKALAERGVNGARVSCRTEGEDRPKGTLTVLANGRAETQEFSYEELEDSGEAIDAPAALKVRMLVSKFVQ